MRLPSGREVEVADPTYGQALELQKKVGESSSVFQSAVLDALAPGAQIADLDRLDLLALVRQADVAVAGRDQEAEVVFREQLAARLGGHEVGDPIVLSRLLAYRWCGVLGWTYQDVAETPLDVLPLCLRFRWTRPQLLGTPAAVIRDFLVIFNYETELARSRDDGN